MDKRIQAIISDLKRMRKVMIAQKSSYAECNQLDDEYKVICHLQDQNMLEPILFSFPNSHLKH